LELEGLIMLDKAFFVSQDVHEKEVELADGSKHILYFKEIRAVELQKFRIAQQSADEDVQAGALAKLIAAGLCEPDGKPAITYDQAVLLKPEPMNALFAKIMEVNKFQDNV